MSVNDKILDKRPEETKLEHHKRIINGKLVDKTLVDFDYTELAEVVYGQPYSADVARRMFYGSKRTLDVLTEEVLSELSGDKIISEIEQKTYELQKEKQRFFDQRREYNKLANVDARIEHLYDRLEFAANNLKDSIGSIYKEPVVFETMNNEAVLVLCDWHYGMTTDNIFNKYNTDICKQRVKKVVEDSIKRIKLHHCRKLHILALGDLLHGAIHFTARVASEELVCDQIMQVSEILAQSVEELSRYVEDTYVYVTYGNHARTIQNKKDSTHRDNMERLIPWWLATRLREYENIHIMPESENELILLSVCGHDGFATHGDLDTISRSPKILSTILSKNYGMSVEWGIFADKHHREALDEVGIYPMVCGSLAGTDDYANEKRLYSTPSQLLLIFNEECGIDAEYVLKCG